MGFPSPGPALTRGRGGYLGGDPLPASVQGESRLIPWTGPRCSPPVVTGTRLWNGRGRGPGQGTLKKLTPPRAMQRGGAWSLASGPQLLGPRGPAINTHRGSCLIQQAVFLYHGSCLIRSAVFMIQIPSARVWRGVYAAPDCLLVKVAD